MVRSRKKFVGVSTLVCLMLVLSSCGSSQAASHSGATTASAKVTLTKPSEAAPITTDSTQLLPQRVDTTGTVALWDYVPKAPAFNERVASAVLEQVRAFANTQGTTYVPTAQSPLPLGAPVAPRGCVGGDTYRSAAELLADPNYGSSEGSHMLVACDIPFAAGPTIAQRIRAVSGDANVATSDTTTTIYANVETNEVATESELFKTEALPDLMNRTLELTKMSPVSDPTSVDDFKEALKNLTFAPDGSITLTVDADFFNQENGADVADVTLAIAPDAVNSFLTPLGAQIAQSIAQKDEFTGASANRDSGYENCELSPCVALTFDDGPSAETTPALLEDLAAQGASVTFFVLGQNAEAFPELVKQEAEAGHEVESHTYGHADLTTSGAEKVHNELEWTAAIVENATGHRPEAFRPPYGSWDDQVLDAAGVPAILWSIDTDDWQKPEIETLVSRVVDEAVPGDIILMHDIHPTTVESIPAILEGLDRRGFSFATINQLFGSIPEPGDIYYHSAEASSNKL